MAKKKLSDIEKQKILLKARIELSPKPEYSIRTGGDMGPTLCINCGEDHVLSKNLRAKIPGKWEGLYTVVLRIGDPTDDDEIKEFKLDIRKKVEPEA